MNKKNLTILTALIAVSLVGAAFAIIGKPRQKAIDTQSAVKQEQQVAESNENASVTNKANEPAAVAESQQEETIRSEEVEVSNNTPEFELKVYLCQEKSGETYLKFEYYNEGASVVKKASSDIILELKGIFESKAGNQGSKDAFKVNPVSLNTKNLKVYFFVKGKPVGEEVQTTLYSYSLKDSSALKLFSQVGRSTELKLSKDMKYLAFSYYDSPAGSNYQEKSLLQVLDCGNDKFLVNGSRDQKGILLGNNKDDKLIYDYSFIMWQSNTAIKLKEAAYPKTGGTGEKIRELVYDIPKNLLLNTDGSAAVQGDKGGQQEKAESEAVKTLKGFYSFISSGQYQKAYDILDDKFQLNAFKLLGVTELSKKDIDVENFSVYGGLFKSAKVESIVQENSGASTSTIYFYQEITISEGNVAKQALVAKLRKTSNGWKIAAVSDGNINEKPFKQ